MKRHFVVALLVLGSVSAVRAQEQVPDTTPASRNAAAEFSASPAESAALFLPVHTIALSSASGFASPAAAIPADVNDAADPAPSPTPNPDPKFLYGGRDDFRWQLAIGADWVRFRSALFNASAVGVKTSVTYFTNEWFGVEGNVTTAFAPEIFQNEHVKVLIYGGGPKIAWRQRKWEPWMHAIVGGSHEQPQVAGHGKNAFAVEAGGGADYRFNPRLSGRLEGDWVHTNFFGQTQNNFELMGGVVFHF
jgi:hypothetical protein